MDSQQLCVRLSSVRCHACAKVATLPQRSGALRATRNSGLKMRWGLFVMGTLGLVVGICGLTVLTLIGSIVDSRMKQELPLVDGSESLKRWIDPEVPIYVKYYIYHVTNPQEALEGGTPVKLEEKGPYTFLEKRVKGPFTFEDNGKQLKYSPRNMYYFEPGLSEGSLEDKITFINAPLMALAAILVLIDTPVNKDKMELLISQSNDVMNQQNTKVFTERTARELLFEGYEDSLIEELLPLARMIVSIPESLSPHFSVGKNDSDFLGNWTIRTGIDDINNFAQVIEWNNKTELDFWSGSFCNQIKGTDGAQFPPNIEKKDTLYVYSPQLCRSLSMTYVEDSEVQGISTFKFADPDTYYESPIYGGPNKCFCRNPRYDPECRVEGTFELSVCSEGLPVVLTYPHFYRGGKELHQYVSGLSPKKSLHDNYLHVIPRLGQTVDFRSRFQVNIQVINNSGINLLSKMPNFAMPIAWLEESATLDDKAANMIESILAKVNLMKGLSWAAFGIGVILFFLSVSICVKGRAKKSKGPKIGNVVAIKLLNK